METQNEKKAREIAQYHCANELSLIQSYNAALEAMEWKDEQFKGFLFELALKITTPKTDFDKAIASAFPMSGLDAVDDVLASLQNEWFDYQNKGTILND